jgi:hypothetical protein
MEREGIAALATRAGFGDIAEALAALAIHGFRLQAVDNVVSATRLGEEPGLVVDGRVLYTPPDVVDRGRRAPRSRRTARSRRLLRTSDDDPGGRRT